MAQPVGPNLDGLVDDLVRTWPEEGVSEGGTVSARREATIDPLGGPVCHNVEDARSAVPTSGARDAVWPGGRWARSAPAPLPVGARARFNFEGCQTSTDP